IFNLISNNEIQLQESKLEKQSVEINTNKQDSVLETRIDLPKSFKDFMDHWEKTDILEDAVWDLSNLGRESYFDLGAYLYNHSANENENIKPKLSIQTPLGNNYANLAKKEFIETSRKLVKKLNFEIVKEDYNDIFLSTGDGIDYFTYIKGNDKDKFIVQIRRWNTNSIGELVIKDLAHKIKEKNAKQGIFITTGELSQEAMDYVEQSNNINIIQNKQLEFLLNGLISEN
ncbi:MAG: restriction endonuclease, partial [Spirochaetota bacterium]|nr:restriction endonuclease [Spirochaetota bacterium]